MNRTLFFSLMIAVGGASTVSAQAPADKHEHSQPAILQRFAQLAGEWVGKGTHDGAGQDARISYRLTSGGTAVVETIDPGGNHEMVTVIHPDGDSLLLTHYCMIGNQPQMRATPKPGDNKVAFEFVKATNMKSEKEMHMRTVTYTFVDKDTLRAEWTTYVDGKDGGKAVFEMKRKK